MRGDVAVQFDDSSVLLSGACHCPEQLQLRGLPKSLSEYLKRFEGDALVGGPKWKDEATISRVIPAVVASFSAIAILMAIDAHMSAAINVHSMLNSCGAAAVLLFVAPDAPLSQPKNAFVGNLFAGIS